MLNTTTEIKKLTQFPEIMKDWDFEKNKDISIDSLLAGSNKDVEWACHKCGHKWRTRVIHRTTGTNCPNCTPKKPNKDSLDISHPHIAAQWDYEANAHHLPQNFKAGSNFKAVFVCEKGHKSTTSIYHKTNGRACPYCTNQKVGYGNSFGDNYPLEASWWHPTKNGDLTPYDVTPKSNKKVYWLKNGVEMYGRVCDKIIGNKNRLN